MKVSEYINQIIALTFDEMESIENAFEDLHLKKGEFLAEEGKICRTIGFIVKGRLRNFYFDEQANEKTCFFASDNTFISSYTSFLTKTPSFENIEAIEDSQLKVISMQGLEELSNAVPKIHIFRRIMSENMYIIMEKRIQSLQSATALERYEKILKENPDIMLSVPLQYTASFLGITPQHLSRLRKNNQK